MSSKVGGFIEPEVMGPTNSTEDQIRSLKDQVDVLQNKLRNQITTQGSSKELDKRAVLGMFSPAVTDKTDRQDTIAIKNLKYTAVKAKNQVTLSFELHNTKPDLNVQKGYIVVMARSEKNIRAYPNVFTVDSPYLLDFEKGETFQVARFRMVNAQFDVDEEPDVFQILIFNRAGELLVNTTQEVSKK